jgi:hypothetical protein
MVPAQEKTTASDNGSKPLGLRVRRGEEVINCKHKQNSFQTKFT